MFPEDLAVIDIDKTLDWKESLMTKKNDDGKPSFFARYIDGKGQQPEPAEGSEHDSSEPSEPEAETTSASASVFELPKKASPRATVGSLTPADASGVLRN
jgi:hypothetical protein